MRYVKRKLLYQAKLKMQIIINLSKPEPQFLTISYNFPKKNKLYNNDRNQNICIKSMLNILR